MNFPPHMHRTARSTSGERPLKLSARHAAPPAARLAELQRGRATLLSLDMALLAPIAPAPTALAPLAAVGLVDVRASLCGKGLGGFATRDVHVGERLLAEHPLVKCRATTREGLALIVGALSESKQEEFFALCQSEKHGVAKSALGIWKSNAFPTGDNCGSSAVFATICRLNHDCRPNAHVCWNENIGMQTVHVLREIRADEEVCVAYIGGDADGTRATRQSALREKFSFTCACPQCELTGAALEESEARQRRLNEIVAHLKTHPADVVAIVQERLSLMSLERMPGVWCKASVLLAIESVLTGRAGPRGVPATGIAHTRQAAWTLAHDARQCCSHAMGDDARETVAFATFMSHPSFAKLQRKSDKARHKKRRDGGGGASAVGGAVTTRAPQAPLLVDSASSRGFGTVQQDINQLSVQMDAARRALAEANSEAKAADEREAAVRARAAEAAEALARQHKQLLVLAREGNRGSSWGFARGTLDNQSISWTDFEYAAARLGRPRPRSNGRSVTGEECVPLYRTLWLLYAWLTPPPPLSRRALFEPLREQRT